MKPKIWKDKDRWYVCYQLNHYGLNDTVSGVNFPSWDIAIGWLQCYHKVIQWPTKPNAS